jgi:hypothetical protein
VRNRVAGESPCASLPEHFFEGTLVEVTIILGGIFKISYYRARESEIASSVDRSRESESHFIRSHKFDDEALTLSRPRIKMRDAKGNVMKNAVRWALVAAFFILAFAIRTSGQASQPEITVAPIVQKGAPIEIVSIKADGANLLATLVLKNTTNHYIQYFNVTWTALRPANCAANSPDAPLQQLKSEGHQVYATTAGKKNEADRSADQRVIKPHDQIEITSLSLTRNDLLDLAKKNNAKKVQVQVAIGWVNFTTSENFSDHDGPPDWFDPTVMKMGILDADDAAKQACN